MPDYVKELRDTTYDFPLSYIYEEYGGVDNLLHERHKIKLYERVQRDLVSALLNPVDRHPVKTRLNDILSQQKIKDIVKRIDSDQCFSHLTSNEQRIAVDSLLSRLDMTRLETRTENLEPIDNMDEELLDFEFSAKSGEKAVTAVDAVYIPGFIDKNVAESGIKEYDDPTMHSIENLEYPYVLPHSRPRDAKFVKEKYAAIDQVVQSHKLLTKLQKEALYALLCKHETRFSIGGENLGQVNTVKHEINTTDLPVPRS